MQEAKEKSETATETDEDRDSVRGTIQLQQPQRSEVPQSYLRAAVKWLLTGTRTKDESL